MRKIFLALTVIGLVIISSSMAFAYSEDDARDALITYSGTRAFEKLLPEERRACMSWLAQGGYMSELCRSAVTRLVAEDPNAVSPSQRKALLAAASARTTPTNSGETVIVESDNTGAMIAAGIVGVIAGMIIHNNLPSDRDRVYYPHYRYPKPHYRPAPPHYRPAPPHYRSAPPRYRSAPPHYRPAPPSYRHPQPVMRHPSPIRHTPPRSVPHRSPAPHVIRVPNRTTRDIPRR